MPVTVGSRSGSPPDLLICLAVGSTAEEVREALPAGWQHAGLPANGPSAQAVALFDPSGRHELIVIHAADQGECLAALQRTLARRALPPRLEVQPILGLAAFDDPQWAARLTHALEFATYRFDRYKSTRAPVPAIKIVVEEQRTAERVARDVGAAGRRAAAVSWARNLVNTPAMDATPAALADEVAKVLAPLGVATDLITGDRLTEGGWGGVLGVTQGSLCPPVALELQWQGGGSADGPLVLCGKGVTFDAGGLSIKNDRAQAYMKSDMAGAAAVFAAVRSCAEARLKLNVIALVPLVENMVGPGGIRPGDVVRHPNGATTEVVNTDAEGRLILADALVHATRRGPRMIIDVATLTGPLLGERWLVIGNDTWLADQLTAAGGRVGDPGWRLPLAPELLAKLASAVADQKNFCFDDEPYLDTLTAAAFLHTFVGRVPWAHMDVAGTAFRHKPGAAAEGATGSPAHVLIELLETLDAKYNA